METRYNVCSRDPQKFESYHDNNITVRYMHVRYSEFPLYHIYCCCCGEICCAIQPSWYKNVNPALVVGVATAKSQAKPGEPFCSTKLKQLETSNLVKSVLNWPFMAAWTYICAPCKICRKLLVFSSKANCLKCGTIDLTGAAGEGISSNLFCRQMEFQANLSTETAII